MTRWNILGREIDWNNPEDKREYAREQARIKREYTGSQETIDRRQLRRIVKAKIVKKRIVGVKVTAYLYELMKIEAKLCEITVNEWALNVIKSQFYHVKN